MFETWLEQEKRAIKLHFDNVRMFFILIAVFIVFSVWSVILLLEGGWATKLIAVIFSVCVLVFTLDMSSHKKRFMKPLMASVERELPTEKARQEFAQQMKEQAVSISYQPVPQTKCCDIMVAKDYCYMRQPKKCGIIRNCQIRRIILAQEDYFVGNRGHVRWCFALSLYTSDNENPVWKGYFTDKGTAAQAFAQFQAILPPEASVEDYVAHPEKRAKKSQWKFWLEWIVCVLFVAACYFLYKYFL